MSSRHVLTRGKKQRALSLFRQQRITEAKDIYEEICRIDPRDAQSWCALSTLHGMLGNHSEVVRCAQRAVEIDPDYPDAHGNLSAAYEALGQSEKAEASARRALKGAPNSLSALVNLGSALRSLGRFDEAVATYLSALMIDSQDAEARAGLDIALVQQGRFEEAIARYRETLRINPHFAPSHVAVGAALKILGRHDEAIAALRQAIALKPDYIVAWDLLGKILSAQGKLTEALDCFQQATRNAPAWFEGLANIADVMAMQMRHEEGLAILRNAVARDPTREITYSSYIFMLSYTPGVDAAVVFSEHANWGRLHTHLPRCQHDGITTDPDRQLRIGYVSPDFRQHSVGYFIEPVLARHDRNAVEVFCYANVPVPDATTERLQRLGPRWRSIYGKSDAQVVEIIRNDQIDILVDLAGHTANRRLLVFARKPAPVQASYLGYPNTTGLPQIDYRLTDEWADPPGQEAFHTEALVRLPYGFLCYQPPVHAPAVEPSPVTRTGHITFGSFNAPHKINQAILDLWAAILRDTPGSRLILKNKALRDAPTRTRYLARLAEGGISADRVELLGWLDSSTDHLALYHRLDIALDTFPYCGTTTTCEALWMGVPVVTLVGQRHIERVGWSLLTRVGLPELAASDKDGYVRAATELARDVHRLATLRSGLRERMRQSPLCDAVGFTRSLETAYRQMWRDWIARQPADGGQNSQRNPGS